MKVILSVACLLALSAPALAGKAGTLADLRKQAEKLSPSRDGTNPHLQAKTLCICHVGDGRGVLGYVAHRVIFFQSAPTGNEVQLECRVGRYNISTDVLTTERSCVGDGFGTFWETLK